MGIGVGVEVGVAVGVGVGVVVGVGIEVDVAVGVEAGSPDVHAPRTKASAIASKGINRWMWAGLLQRHLARTI